MIALASAAAYKESQGLEASFLMYRVGIVYIRMPVSIIRRGME
jgi:hypothetical protein